MPPMPERDADEPDTEPMSEVDAVRWLSARTLADVGELTALFLEGHLQQTPTHMGSPDTETIALIPVLAACNRTGFVTHQSQPGTPHDEAPSAPTSPATPTARHSRASWPRSLTQT